MRDLDRLRLLEAAVEQSFNAVVITTSHLDRPGPEIVYVNQAFVDLTGYDREELIGATPRILQGPMTNVRTLARMRRALENGEPFEGQTVNYRKDRSAYHVEWNIAPVRDEHGRVAHFVSVQRDITDRIQQRQDRELLSTALEESADNVLITDVDGHIVYVNRAFEEHTGYDREEVLGKNPRILNSGAHDAGFYRRLWDTLGRGEAFRETFVDRDKRGERFYMEQTITPVTDDRGRIVRYVSTGKDITERVEMEQELERMATTDRLTGAMNRLRFEDVLEQEMERARRYRRTLSLIMFDVDEFKQVNDRFGHDAGDAVLERLAAVVGDNLRASDQMARWGGEEFMVLSPEADLEAACEIAEKLRAELERADFPGVGRVTASFGVSEMRPEDTPKRLLKRADNALYEAKESGRNRVCPAPPAA